MRGRSLLLLTLVSVSGPAVAQEWTRFRGPNGQGVGHAPGLPAVLGESAVRWRVPVHGGGHGSPVLWGDRLFLTRIGKEKGVREVVGFDARSGKELWKTACDFEVHRQHKLNNAASATPAVDATGIYVVWSSGSELVAVSFDLEGKRRWRRVLGGFQAQHGSGASPILHDGMMIVANDHEGKDSFLIALHCASGEVKWKTPRRTFPERGAYSCPVVYRPEKGDPYLLFTSTAHGLTAVEPKTGACRWELEVGFKQRCVNVPVLHGDHVFFSAGAGGAGRECAFVQLPASAKGSPKVVRGLRRAIPYVPSGLILDGCVYLFADGGIASCVEVETGKLLWRERLDGSFFSSPVSNGKAIYVADRSGKLFSLAPKGKGEVLGTFDLGKGVFATPALALGRLYVRTFDELVCFGAVPTPPRGPRKGY